MSASRSRPLVSSPNRAVAPARWFANGRANRSSDASGGKDGGRTKLAHLPIKDIPSVNGGTRVRKWCGSDAIAKNLGAPQNFCAIPRVVNRRELPPQPMALCPARPTVSTTAHGVKGDMGAVCSKRVRARSLSLSPARSHARRARAALHVGEAARIVSSQRFPRNLLHPSSLRLALLLLCIEEDIVDDSRHKAQLLGTGSGCQCNKGRTPG